MEGSEVGRRLAERHTAEASDGHEIEVDPVRSLLATAEVPHVGDWTLRSALVRLAQRDPTRVGALLQVMRRLDAPLHHVARVLQANGATCDESLASDDLDLTSSDPTSNDLASEDLGADQADGAPATDAVLGPEPLQPYPDVRTADLARVVAAGADEGAVLAGYQAVAPLEREEELAVPLLAISARFDRLARRLAIWADGDLTDPPLDAVDRLTAEATARLDELGVPVETGPPPRGTRSRG